MPEPEGAREEDGRRAVLLAGLGEVELDRLAALAEGVADVGADIRSRVGDRRWDHGRELVGEEVLLVAGDREGLAGERGEKRGCAARRAGGGAGPGRSAGGASSTRLSGSRRLGALGAERQNHPGAQERRAVRAAEAAAPSSGAPGPGARSPGSRARGGRPPPRSRILVGVDHLRFRESCSASRFAIHSAVKTASTGNPAARGARRGARRGLRGEEDLLGERAGDQERLVAGAELALDLAGRVRRS